MPRRDPDAAPGSRDSTTLKQYQERLMAECLLENPELHIRSVRLGEPPGTDILLEMESGEFVAVEVRGLTNRVMRESIATRARIGRVAEARLMGRVVNAHIAWRSGVIVPPKKSALLGEEIAAAVTAMMRDGRTALGEVDEVPSPLASYVATVHLYPPEEDGPRVHTSLESWDGSGSTDVIQTALDEKEERLASYRRAHPGSAIWLLLWTSAGESQPVTTQMLDPAHVFRSGFNKAFVLDYPSRTLKELKLNPVLTGEGHRE